MEGIILGVCQIFLHWSPAPPLRQQKRLQSQESLDLKRVAEGDWQQKLHASELLPSSILEKSLKPVTPMTAGETSSPKGQGSFTYCRGSNSPALPSMMEAGWYNMIRQLVAGAMNCIENTTKSVIHCQQLYKQVQPHLFHFHHFFLSLELCIVDEYRTCPRKIRHLF